MTEKMQIDLVEYRNFRSKYLAGEFQAQRYGQAFHNHFNLYKINNKKLADELYQADEVRAKELIQEWFIFA